MELRLYRESWDCKERAGTVKRELKLYRGS